MINSFRSAIVFCLGSFSWVLQSGSVVLWVAIANQNEPGKVTGLYLASQSGLARAALGCPRERLFFWVFFGWHLCGAVKQHCCRSLVPRNQGSFLGWWGLWWPHRAAGSGGCLRKPLNLDWVLQSGTAAFPVASSVPCCVHLESAAGSSVPWAPGTELGSEWQTNPCPAPLLKGDPSLCPIAFFAFQRTDLSFLTPCTKAQI